MGRELRRMPLDFDWPLGEPWEGFFNPLYVATKCVECGRSGLSPEAQRLKDLWYGYIPFRPEDRGSTPLVSTDAPVLAFAKRNVDHSQKFYGHGDLAIQQESRRLCALWNGSWSHHLNADDVAALIEGGRLMDFTHTWKAGDGWKPKVPAYLPTPQEVNIWSISGFGHDSINQWICVGAECKRLGVPETCVSCAGQGDHWPSPEAEQTYEDWKPTPPPIGDGYQIWETVSEGSPISPVFSTPEDLARYMAGTRWGADQGTPYATWLAFIQGPGWAPSMIVSSAGIQTGVEAVVAMG